MNTRFNQANQDLQWRDFVMINNYKGKAEKGNHKKYRYSLLYRNYFSSINLGMYVLKNNKLQGKLAVKMSKFQSKRAQGIIKFCRLKKWHHKEY